MSDFVPYSEKQQVLPSDMWEGEGFLNYDCKTNKVSAEFMRAVVTRLLKIDKTGKDFDINDFEFLVYDNEQPNAGFISSAHTLNHKNVITVSTGITKLCKTEDEFASILAHELGHFTYDKIYGKNNNTIFQERFSDLHALDLMIAGGYNPVAYSNVCETMRQSSGGSWFDVHGSSMARKEDVDAYLTKLHKDRGDFKSSTPTGLWNNFVKVINSGKDKYKPYFTQLLEYTFPKISKNPWYVPPVNLIFDMILLEAKNGRFNSYQRVEDMLEYIENYPAKSKREIQSTQNFLEQLINLHNQDATLRDFLANYKIVRLSKVLKQKFRDNKPFKIFHPVNEGLDKIDEFMKTRDVARVKELALDLYHDEKRIFKVSDLKDVFGKPSGFKMPSRAMAKGHTMPTDWLISMAQQMDVETRYIMENIVYDIGFDCGYKWITDKRLDDSWNHSANWTGKILATNKREIDNLQAQHKRREKYKEKHSDFNDFIYAINVLYEFDMGKISVTEVVNRLAQYGNRPGVGVGYQIDSVLYWLHDRVRLVDYRHENKFLKSELRELNNNPAFAEIYIKPFLEMVKTALHDTAPQLANQIQLDNPPHGKTWFSYLQDVLSKYVKLKEDISNGAHDARDLLMNAVVRAGRKVGMQDSEASIWNVSAGPIMKHISGICTTRLHNILVKFIQSAVQEGVYSQQDAAKLLFRQIWFGAAIRWDDFTETKIIKNMRKLEYETERKIEDDMIERYSIYADRKQWIGDNYSKINEALDEEIKQNTDLHKIHRLLTAFNMVAKTDEELINVLSKPIPRLSHESLYILETKLKEYAFTYYMRKNPPIKDLYPVLFAICFDYESRFTDYFADELADYIEKNNLMPTNFQGMYDLHAVMQKLNIFSKEKSNHKKFLNPLIATIEKMPPKFREEYSWKLLSGFYYSDDDEHSVLNRKSDDIGTPLARNKLLKIYTDVVAQRIGRDDNSDEYFAKIQQLSQFINEKHFYDKYRTTDGKYYGSKRNGITRTTQAELYRLLSDKIQSQERVSKFLANDKNVVFADADAQAKDKLGRGIETLLDELSHHKNVSIYTIEFLNRKLTAKSIDDYRTKCAQDSEYEGVNSGIKPSILENLYNTFWASGLEIRAVIMNKLLNRAFETLDEKIKYVCDMNFGKDNKYRADAEMICDCVVKSFQPYEQNLILAAIASADGNKEEGKNSSRSVGDGLRMFFENMGPAWVKFGQLLSYVPDLPSEIRHDLAKLKDRADMPARWDVYTWLHQALPNDLYNRIERVEDIVGAGSFWMTAIVLFKNERGEPEQKVIQLLRPYADERADSGFKTIEIAIEKLAKRNSAYKILRNVAHQAHESAKYEVDADIGNKQYEKAKDLYSDIRVSIEGTEYTPRVADWRYYGAGYKIMDYAPGATLSRVNVDDNERRKMALAYFTIEMVNLFKGDVWDIDRHQGQQNFDVISPANVDINIYDTGAQLPKAPDNKNKVLLANIFFGLTQAVQSGKSIDSYLLQIIKRLDRLQNNLNMDVSYVSNVQKGLMALSDIIEYQKEIKDTDGNVIQKRKALSANDLRCAIIAVLQNPSIDKYINAVIKGRAVASKIVRLQIKELKELAHSSEFGPDNPVKIKILTKSDNSSKSRQMTKADFEIATLEDPDDSILGIQKKYIDQQSRQ
jgi:hypothetical protein